MKIAVNNDVIIPIRRVVANPLIGPVPKIKRINAVRPVVMLASKIDERALLNPSAIAFLTPLPFYISSLIHSKIRTFASTEMPIVKTIPAIPGNVKTAPKPASTPKIRTRFNINAISAKIPDDP